MNKNKDFTETELKLKEITKELSKLYLNFGKELNKINDKIIQIK